MPTLDNRLVDTQATLLEGMNRSRDPALIGEHQAALLRNVSVRGGKAKSRPRFIKRADLPAGKLQGAHLFSKTGTIFLSASGRVYEIQPKDWTYEEKTSDDDRNNANKPRHFYTETVASLIIQDGQSKPIIADGANFRRAAKDEVPVGTAMAYGNGRLAVAINGGSDVRIGDIRKKNHQSELKFTEWTSLSGGGDISFGEPVKSLTFLPVIDTASGHGPLIVGCQNAVYTLRTQLTQRDLWAEVAFQTKLLPNRGTTGPSATTAVNQDLYFRSSDGLRSIRTSTADYSAPGLAPLSVEVRNRFDYDSQFLLEDAQVVLFDNRLICTHSPFVYSDRSMAQGLIAFNFDSISTRGQKSNPVYDGEWDEMLIANITVGMIDGVERCFITGVDSDGQNSLWELMPETYSSAADSVTQVLETRTLYGDAPGTLKHLRRADLWFSDIVGDLSVRVMYRPAHYPYWLDWDTFNSSVSGTLEDWGTVTKQRRANLCTTQPSEDLDPQTDRPYSTGEGFQVRVEWDGIARLDHLQVWQERIFEGPYAPDFPDSVGILTEPPSGASSPTFWNEHKNSPLAGIV
jgi:hypothetical protein